MKVSEISIPEVYLQSYDFRFFIRLIETCLVKLQYDIDNLVDLYDPLRCPEDLLWMLADTMGYKKDDRFSSAYCRLVLLNFMKMIKYKGSSTGVALAAALNVSQFNIAKYGEEKPILNNRLEDTSIPTQSAYVQEHTEDGYIDVVYYTNQMPQDACIEYARPLGMYVFAHMGVSYQSKTKLGIDARLTNTADFSSNAGITRVGNYTFQDYSKMQKMYSEVHHVIDVEDSRQPVWNRNSKAEGEPKAYPAPGFRSLYSLQLCNTKHQVNAMISVPQGYKPIQDMTEDDVVIVEPRPYVRRPRSKVNLNDTSNVVVVSSTESPTSKPKAKKKKKEDLTSMGQMGAEMGGAVTTSSTSDMAPDTMVQVKKSTEQTISRVKAPEIPQPSKPIESRKKQLRDRRNSRNNSNLI